MTARLTSFHQLMMRNLLNTISPLILNPNEIHLWFSFPDEIRDVRLLLAYKKLLSPDELDKERRFHFLKHRHQYLIARALIRSTLSRYTAIEPKLLRFFKNYYGRPEILPPEGIPIPPIRFSLSHTDGLIVCAVVLKQDIGVDVENTKPKEVPLNCIDRFFSPKEISELCTLSDRMKQDRFFDYWTLKESYIKARGMGLSMPLDLFSFHFSENGPLRIAFGTRLKDDPNRWQFWLLRPTPQNKAALSVCRDSKVDYHLSIKKVVPLMREHNFNCIILRQS